MKSTDTAGRGVGLRLPSAIHVLDNSSWPQFRGADHLRTTRHKATPVHPPVHLAGPFHLHRSPFSPWASTQRHGQLRVLATPSELLRHCFRHRRRRRMIGHSICLGMGHRKSSSARNSKDEGGFYCHNEILTTNTCRATFERARIPPLCRKGHKNLIAEAPTRLAGEGEITNSTLGIRKTNQLVKYNGRRKKQVQKPYKLLPNKPRRP